MKRNKQLSINMVASFINFGISLGISFFLSPYIVRTIGVEANGFISLANNFVSYTSIITIALNSMAGRFFTISYTQNDIEDANKYFVSALFANITIASIFGVIGIFIIIFIKVIINISDCLIFDVKILFALVFISCLLGIISSTFSIATFATNKLYLEYIRTMQGNIARAVVIAGSFFLFKPHMWFVGLGGIVSGLIVFAYDLYYTKILLPEIKIAKKYFSFKSIWTLVKSGIWNTINRLGQILADGLDLLITNLFIDATAMGILSLAKTIPNIILSLIGSAVGVFSPDYTILYAEKKCDELVSTVRQSMRIMGFISNVPIIVLLVCGEDFFRLWQPTQNASQLQILSVITVLCLIFSGSVNCLYNIFTVVNKLKLNSIVVLIHGLISTLIVFVLLKTTSLGIYAVAGVSTTLGVFRLLIITVPYGAICLGLKWYTFYKDVFIPVGYTIIAAGISMLIVNKLPVHGWITLIGKGTIVVIIAVMVGLLVMLNKHERQILTSKILKR